MFYTGKYDKMHGFNKFCVSLVSDYVLQYTNQKHFESRGFILISLLFHIAFISLLLILLILWVVKSDLQFKVYDLRNGLQFWLVSKMWNVENCSVISGQFI